MKRLFLLLGAMGIAFGVLFVPVRQALLFEEGETGRVLAQQVLGSSKKFQIQYTHSIHKTPVIESYRVKGGMIVQQSISYKDFGVGMPENADKGERFRKVKGMYVLDHMNREFVTIDMRTGKVIANHRLIVDGEEVPFSTFITPGTWVRIKQERISVWNMLKGGDIIEN